MVSDGSGGRVKNPTCDGLIIKALKKCILHIQ